MRENEFDLGYRVLDFDLIDSEGRRCGKVDDIELEGAPGRPAKLAAILVGPGAWSRRLPGPAARAVARLWGDGIVRVPWTEVKDVKSAVELKRPAEKLGLGLGDDQARRLVSWIPGSDG